jgi:rubredoxin
MPASFVCPVCGFPELTEQPRHDDGGASDEICPSCGFQFGYDDDDRGITFDEWRQDWIENGMRWSGEGIPPPTNWNPDAQLRNLG